MTDFEGCGWLLNSGPYGAKVRRCELPRNHRGPHTDDPEWLLLTDDERIALEQHAASVKP